MNCVICQSNNPLQKLPVKNYPAGNLFCLENCYIEELYLDTCIDCSESYICGKLINDIENILVEVIIQKENISCNEFKFLRKYLGLSKTALANKLNKTVDEIISNEKVEVKDDKMLIELVKRNFKLDIDENLKEKVLYK